DVDDRGDDVRIGVAQDERPRRPDEVEVAVPVNIEDERPDAALDEDRRAADRLERAHGRVHPAREERLRAFEQRRGARTLAAWIGGHRRAYSSPPPSLSGSSAPPSSSSSPSASSSAAASSPRSSAASGWASSSARAAATSGATSPSPSSFSAIRSIA